MSFYEQLEQYQSALTDAYRQIPQDQINNVINPLIHAQHHNSSNVFGKYTLRYSSHLQELFFPFGHLLKTLNICCNTYFSAITTLSSSDVINMPVDKLQRTLFDSPPSYPKIRILYIPKNFSAFVEKAVTELGCVDKKTLSLVLQQHKNHKVRIFQHEFTPADSTNKVVTIVTNEINSPFMYRAFALFPRLYADLTGITLPPEIIAIYAALGNQNYNDWYSAYTSFIETLDFETEKIKHFCTLFFSDLTQTQIIHYTSEINSYNNNIASSLQNIANMHANIQDLQAKQFYLENKPPEDNDEIQDFLIQNKKAFKILKHDTEGRISISVKTPLLYWSDDTAEILYENKHHSMHKNKEVAWFFNEVFIKKRIQMLVEMQLQLNLITGKITRHYTGNGGDVGDGTHTSVITPYTQHPNPHLHFHSCWGSNRPNIERALQKHDYLYAFNLIQAAIASINLLDGTVSRKFIEVLNWLVLKKDEAHNCMINLRTAHMHANIAKDGDGTLWTGAQLQELYNKYNPEG